MAYRIGLDRLDHIRTLYPDWRNVSDEDIQEWKSLWWCLYRLDAYSNLSSGTPYLIDDTVISTSFIQDHSTHSLDTTGAFQKLHLPSNLEKLSHVLRAASLAPQTSLQNVHNITVSTLRQAGLVIRLHLLQDHERLSAQVTKVQRLLATIRLALPPGWLNPRRNAFINESHADYHARTVTVLHLKMAQLLLSIADPDLREETKWLASWQQVIEACQDIASVTDQWDSSICLAVDPAISFTIFTALIFLDLHKKTAIMMENNLSSSNVEHHITILHLQLRNFGNVWTLPRLLKCRPFSISRSH